MSRIRFETERLFPLPAGRKQPARLKPPGLPVWTASKARLIERYLRLFVYITRHGTYIDGFAGPQYPDIEEYAAKLVVESEPARLRHFYLFDKGRRPLRALHRLREQHPGRDIQIYKGDFNTNIDRILCSEVLRPTEATFCLLDQRTFECQWSTVRRLAAYRTEGYKMELFYFLANWWFERAFAETEDEERLRAWWGRDDWSRFAALQRPQRAVLLQERFRDELDYQFADARAIYGTEDNKTKIMYYMVHATDHPEAPKLMERAYNKTVNRELGQQLRMYPMYP